MSLILDALRKSESERQRTQVPGLLAHPQPATPAAVSPLPVRRLWWLGGALALGAVLLGVWWPRASSPSSAEQPQPARAAVATSAPANAIASAVQAPATISRPTDADVPRRLVLKPPAPAQRDSTPEDVARPAASQPSLPTPPLPAHPSTPPDAPLPIPAAAASRDAAILRVADLGSAERKQLPPLKLSMHMWNEVPAQRFVIIDGTRLTIGERLGDVAIADIVSDGVLLDWNGRLLKLPLR